MTPPGVDVILPFHRGREFAAEAIESVLAQSHEPVHLTVVDDASPDEDFAWLSDRFGDRFERLTLMRLESQHRAAGARMHVVGRTHQELIAFIDQDDRWHPDKLARQVAQLGPDAGFQAAHSHTVHIDAGGNLLPDSADAENAARDDVDWSGLSSQELVASVFERNRIRLASAVVRRDAFLACGGFDPELFGGEDWDFWVRFAAAGNRIALVPEPLLERRIHAGNVSSRYASERLRGALAAADAAARRHPELAALAARRRATLLRTDAVDQLRAGRGRATRESLDELAAQTDPNIETRFLRALSYLGPLAPPLLKLADRLRR